MRLHIFFSKSQHQYRNTKIIKHPICTIDKNLIQNQNFDLKIICGSSNEPHLFDSHHFHYSLNNFKNIVPIWKWLEKRNFRNIPKPKHDKSKRPHQRPALLKPSKNNNRTVENLHPTQPATEQNSKFKQFKFKRAELDLRREPRLRVLSARDWVHDCRPARCRLTAR